jgi:hypothetical protein
MPYEFSASEDFYTIRLYGRLTDEDLERLFAEMEKAENTAPVALNRVTDATDVLFFEIHSDPVTALTERRRTVRLKNTIKSAIIVRREVALGYARLFQMLHDHPQIEIRTVNNREEALNWFAEGKAPNS